MRLFVAEYASATLLAEPGSLLSKLPGGEALAWVSSWVWVVHFGPFLFLALLFPDARLPSPRWRPFAWVVGVEWSQGAPLRWLSGPKQPHGSIASTTPSE